MTPQILMINKEELEITIEQIITKAISKFSSKENQNDTKPKTLEEAAAYINMPVPTFRTKVKEKKIKGFKIGKPWRFYTEDLDQFIRSQKSNTDINDFQLG